MVTEKSSDLSEKRVDLPREYEVEPVELVQMNICQSNTCRKDLRWLHYDHEPGVQEKQQVKDQQSYIFVFVSYVTIPISS